MSGKLQVQIDKKKESIINQDITGLSASTYSKLNEIEQSLYRYNKLSSAGLKEEANAESEKLNNLISNFNEDATGEPLKGYICNTKYIWRASSDSCEDCQDLDGTEYDSADEIPEKPHPNCNCYVEEVDEDAENNSGYDDTVPTDNNSNVPVVTTIPSPTIPSPETMTEAGEVISASGTLNDLIKSMGKDSAHGQQVLKKVMKTFNSQFGRSIQASYQSELQTGIKKILNECMDSMKAMKLAGEIAEKASKYLAWAYIFEQAAEGYYSGGSNEAKKKFIGAGIEITSNIVLEIILTSYLGIEALPAFAIILIAEFVLSKFKSINPN